MYLIFDIESIDPTFSPGTGLPKIAGLTNSEALKLIRGFRKLNYDRADVVEVSPPFELGVLAS